MISSRRQFVFQRPLTFILSPSQGERRFVALAGEARALQRFSKQRGEVTAEAAARPAVAPYQALSLVRMFVIAHHKCASWNF